MGFFSTSPSPAAVTDSSIEPSLESLSLNETTTKAKEATTTSTTTSAATPTTTSTATPTTTSTSTKLAPAAALAARDALPPPQGEPRPFSLWSFLKDAAGKQIFVLPLPIGFYLPLTEVQFRLEALEYSARLLDDAAAEAPGSRERAAKVAAFALSHYAATVRLGKPLLPMHGETYDIVDPREGKFRVMGEAVFTSFKEQTIRHAWVAESTTTTVIESSSSSTSSSSSSSSTPLWRVESDDQPVVGFKGTHLDFHLNWRDLVTFSDGESFAYTKPTSVLGNLLGKKNTLTHRGTLALRSSKGIGVDLKFLGEPPSGAGSRLMASMISFRGASEDAATVEHEVKGVFVRKEKTTKNEDGGDDVDVDVDDDEASIGSGQWSPVPGAPLLRGQWHVGLWQHEDKEGADAGESDEANSKKRTLLWKVDHADDATKLEPRFDMSPFAVRLNALDAALDACLPPTDSRRRPDLRALEEGRFDDAYELKMRLENALVARVGEHAKRAAAEAKKSKSPAPSFADASPAPRWFEERSPGSLLLKAGAPALRYRYKGGYWESRAEGKWEGVNERIFEAAAGNGTE